MAGHKGRASRAVALAVVAPAGADTLQSASRPRNGHTWRRLTRGGVREKAHESLPY